jgi:hypothetical protein
VEPREPGRPPAAAPTVQPPPRAAAAALPLLAPEAAAAAPLPPKAAEATPRSLLLVPLVGLQDESLDLGALGRLGLPLGQDAGGERGGDGDLRWVGGERVCVWWLGGMRLRACFG